MPASVVAPDGSASSRSLALRACARDLMPCLLGLALFVGAPSPASANLFPLAPPELWTWAERTAAEALRTAEPSNDLTVGGIAALNRSIESSLDLAQHIAPRWLERVEVDVEFNADLRPDYRIAAVQPLARVGRGHDVVALEGRLGRNSAGAANARVGLAYQGLGDDDPRTLRLRAGLDERWRSGFDRYVVELGLDGSALDLYATLFGEVMSDPTPDAAALPHRLNGYEIDLEAPIPLAPWARLRARRFWHEGSAETVRRDRLSLLLQPLTTLRVEGGVRDGSAHERRWFAEIRYALTLGPR